MQSDSLICLGVGDGWPSTDRNHSAFVYRLGNTTVLVDAGEPVCRAFKLAGLSFNAPDTVVLSHLHADHFGGLLMLLQGMWIEGRKKGLTIYLPDYGVTPVRCLLKTAALCAPLLPFSIRLRPLRPGTTTRIDAVKLKAIWGTHLCELQKRRGARPRPAFASYHFLIETNRLRIGHSSDLGSPADLEPLLTRPLDLLVCELAHFAPAEICTVLRGRQIKKVLFVHLAQKYWADLPHTRKLIARLLPDIPHAFPRDGQVVKLGRTG